jgi:hypothetical protein
MAAVWELPVTQAGNIRRPYEAQLGQRTKTVWDDDILSESIIEGFEKCCVSNEMNGADGGVLWEEDHEENCAYNDESFDSD